METSHFEIIYIGVFKNCQLPLYDNEDIQITSTMSPLVQQWLFRILREVEVFFKNGPKEKNPC